MLEKGRGKTWNSDIFWNTKQLRWLLPASLWNAIIHSLIIRYLLWQTNTTCVLLYGTNLG